MRAGEKLTLIWELTTTFVTFWNICVALKRAVFCKRCYCCLMPVIFAWNSGCWSFSAKYLFQFRWLVPGFVCFTDFDFFFVFITIFVTLDSFLGDRYFVVTCYYISFHFEYFIDKSIGLDNRLFLYKSSPTTRWNNLNTIYIRQRAIYPSCIHAIHLNYQA